jgi:hypothetical protein
VRRLSEGGRNVEKILGAVRGGQTANLAAESVENWFGGGGAFMFKRAERCGDKEARRIAGLGRGVVRVHHFDSPRVSVTYFHA